MGGISINKSVHKIDIPNAKNTSIKSDQIVGQRPTIPMFSSFSGNVKTCKNPGEIRETHIGIDCI